MSEFRTFVCIKNVGVSFKVGEDYTEYAVGSNDCSHFIDRTGSLHQIAKEYRGIHFKIKDLTKAEEIFESRAKKNMIEWNLESFKTNYAKLYKSIIESIELSLAQKEQVIVCDFSFVDWLMENCELAEDNSLWSYAGEDYTNEKLFKIFKFQTYGKI